MLVSENEMINHKKYNELSIYNFRIPLYQRKYAWQKDEVNALLEDLHKNKNNEYYIGNIVVEKKENNFYDVIDGQQRLTTLYLISKIAKVDSENLFKLHYEIRNEDDDFLKDFDNETKKAKADKQFIQNIETILKFQESLKNEEITLSDLLSKCKIALTILPKDIDIVKYFEVMNNRGKQLEKHQILKSELLKMIQKDENKVSDTIDYAKIWDYCSNMNVYIEDSILYGTLKANERNIESSRSPLFKFIEEKDEQQHKYVLDIFKVNDVSSVNEYESSSTPNNLTIRNILNNNINLSNKEEFYIPMDYSSIVKFPIFLIQVLKIFLTLNDTNNTKGNSIEDIVVNDSSLLNYFYKKETKELIFDCNQSKKFILFLLKMRLFYDYFIFKRDEKDKPFLDLITVKNGKITFFEEQKYDKSNQILMLQLLLNFTSPNYFAQDWMAVVLNWLNNTYTYEKLINMNIYSELLSFLEKLDRNMALERLTDKPDLTGLVNNYLINNNKVSNFDEANFEKKSQLNSGTATAHYWFYKLDYLLWKNMDIWQNLEHKFNEDKKFKYMQIQTNFRLSRLNSIEHIHPQSKKDDWDDIYIDCFGNLALISNHMNSALNAQEDYNKRHDIQKQLDNGTIESLKMILAYSKYKEWTSENCNEHQEEMINLLIEDLKNAK